MKGYFMYGSVLSYEKYMEADTGNTIEEVLINTDKVQGIFAGRNTEFVIVGSILKVVDEKSSEPHEVPILDRVKRQGILMEIFGNFGVTEPCHYYYITR